MAGIITQLPGPERSAAGRDPVRKGRAIARACLPCAWILVACSTPDLSPAISESTRLLSATDGDLRPTLSIAAAREQAEAERSAMRGGGMVVALKGDCDPAATHLEGRVFSECELVTLAAPPATPVSATQMLAALDGLRAYYEGLAGLADARTSDDVATATARLFDTLASVGSAEGVPDGLAAAAKSAAGRKDLVTRSAGFLADQSRLAALRRVIRRADPIIGALTERAVAWLDIQPGGVDEARQHLSDARLALLDATEAGDLPRQESETARMRAAFAAFKAAERASPANRLRLLRQMHAELLARSQTPGEAEDFLTVLEEVRAIADLAAKGE